MLCFILHYICVMRILQLFSMFLLGILTLSTFAQESFQPADGLIGKAIISRLADQRFSFNKELIRTRSLDRSKLPVAECIFNKAGVYTISFDKISFVFNNGILEEIKGLKLSRQALVIVASKLSFLDNYQYQCSMIANREYLALDRNLNKIAKIDRQFFSSLKILSSTIKDIANLGAKGTEINFELQLAKMPEPNLDRTILHNQVAGFNAKVITHNY